MAQITTTGRNIRALREDVGLTQTEFGERIGVSVTTVSGWETRGRALRQSNLEEIASVFGVPVDDLVSENGYYAKHRLRRSFEPVPCDTALPIAGVAHAGNPSLAYEVSDDEQWCPPEYAVEGNFYIKVQGDSMNNVLMDGQMALVDTHAEIRNGDIALVKVNGDEATIKRVRLTDGVAILEPDSTNPEHKRRIIDETDPDAPAVRLLGKVVYAVTRL
jgi:repressor LexA